MKIAINKCFGGFGLSGDALLFLIKMDSELVNKSSLSEWDTKSYCFKDRLVPFKEGYILHEFMHILEKDGTVFSDDCRHKDRNHPDLIKVIEELGDKANGQHANLTIVEIPDDIEWDIDEYDGIESIHEKHRSHVFQYLFVGP